MKIFYLPDLGEGLPEAEIREWLIDEGDEVKVDQPIVSVETAKAVVEIPSPRSGRVTKLHGLVGDIISTGAPLLEFETGTTESKTVAGSIETGDLVIEEPAAQAKPSQLPGSSVKALPIVRALAKRLNVDLSTITATGPNHQITLEDVEKAAQFTSPIKAGYEPLHGVRRAMAITMTQLHLEVVPATLNDDAHLENVSPETDITSLIIQAILAGCKTEPVLNAWFDGKSLSRCLHNEVHLGLAIDSPEGLFVPVLKNVSEMSTQAIREQINHFKEQVKNRSLLAEDMHGATFVLSNFGTFAGRYATPVVVSPTVAILGTGRLREEPVVKNGQIIIQNTLPLSLTFDHRAVTGGEASRFLAAVIKYLEG